jgi:hypothetical protein
MREENFKALREKIQASFDRQEGRNPIRSCGHRYGRFLGRAKT